MDIGKTAIVPLGGGIAKDRIGLGPLALQRLDLGISIYQENQDRGINSVFFAIGGPHKLELPDGSILTPNSAVLRYEYLKEKQVPEKDIILLDNGVFIPNRDTWFEAFQIRRKARDLGIRNIVIATNTEHQERAFLIMHAVLKDFPLSLRTVDSKGLISTEEEATRIAAVGKLLSELPEDIPDPEDWEEWCREHRKYYETKKVIYEKLRESGQDDPYVGFEIGPPPNRTERK